MGSLLPLGAPILKHITVLLYFTYRLYFWFFSEYGLVASKLLLFLSFLVILKFEIYCNRLKKRGEEKWPKKKKNGMGVGEEEPIKKKNI